MLILKNIVKQYANHRALDDVSIDIPEGKIFGLLGPNGAGKTSLIRIINQITAPDSGEIYFDNELLSPKHIEQIGYLPEERGLYKKMKVGEQMIYLAQLKGLSKSEAKKRLQYWFEKLDISTWWDKKIEDLSKGMQQKVQFIATILHEPKLIILDEPFSGFDPVNAQIIQDEILELNKNGSTIIYSTHRMETVEELCDNIALINKSKKVLDGSVKEIKKQYQNQSYFIEFTPTGKLVSHENPLYDLLELTAQQDHVEIKIKINSPYQLNDVLNYLIPQVMINQVKEIIPTIHDIFIEKVTQTQEIIHEQN
ncbi:ABC transporter ATP-binding protein [Sphingobacterium litopenaei]|uniref:ATP-binding cassette domain-containing protein n=1 Tax=Sphingobacterium litopenaei TaxID=2763500 RepID=A0ABR7YDU6_9SPHI|nr:ABC transporter ATP-binding protein [Sphingobacterium litopenaei]MBD1429440.1 ATP-binding cassette domain-containing protein [Sphingobacterium litopenaei]